MFWRDAGTGVPNGNFGAGFDRTKQDSNLAVFRRESQRVLDQIADGAIEQKRVRKNFPAAFTFYRDVSVFGRYFVERANFIESEAAIESRPVHLLFGRFGAGEKQQVINDPGQTLALRRRRFDDASIFFRRAIASQSNLSFAEHVADRRSQFVREIGGKLGKSRERIFQSTKHIVERGGQGTQLGRPEFGINPFVQVRWT